MFAISGEKLTMRIRHLAFEALLRQVVIHTDYNFIVFCAFFSGNIYKLQLAICLCVFVHLGWPWKQRLVGQSTASTEASFHSGPMRNAGVCKVSLCMGVGDAQAHSYCRNGRWQYVCM